MTGMAPTLSSIEPDFCNFLPAANCSYPCVHTVTLDTLSLFYKNIEAEISKILKIF